MSAQPTADRYCITKAELTKLAVARHQAADILSRHSSRHPISRNQAMTAAMILMSALSDWQIDELPAELNATGAEVQESAHDGSTAPAAEMTEQVGAQPHVEKFGDSPNSGTLDSSILTENENE